MKAYFSPSECVCRGCEQIFSSIQAFDAHLLPLPSTGGKQSEGLLHTDRSSASVGCLPVEEMLALRDKKERPVLGLLCRSHPRHGDRDVWKFRPWYQTGYFEGMNSG